VFALLLTHSLRSLYPTCCTFFSFGRYLVLRVRHRLGARNAFFFEPFISLLFMVCSRAAASTTRALSFPSSRSPLVSELFRVVTPPLHFHTPFQNLFRASSTLSVPGVPPPFLLRSVCSYEATVSRRPIQLFLSSFSCHAILTPPTFMSLIPFFSPQELPGMIIQCGLCPRVRKSSR